MICDELTQSSVAKTRSTHAEQIPQNRGVPSELLKMLDCSL